MTASVSMPIRVLVKGASTAVYISDMGGPRTDFAFGRVLESELLRNGRPAEVRVNAVPSEQTKTVLRTWEREVLGWSPDVVILHYGHYECIHLLLPRWLERHANSNNWRHGRIRTFYRRKILRAVWISLAKLQSRLDGRINPQLFSWRPRRVAADLQRLIENIQTVGSPLVLVMGILPPARKWWSWMPGLRERTAVMNAALQAMTDGFAQPHIRFFRVSDVTDGRLGEDEEPNPDGGHYSARVHRMIGEALAAEVMKWADTQPHLRLPS